MCGTGPKFEWYSIGFPGNHTLKKLLWYRTKSWFPRQRPRSKRAPWPSGVTSLSATAATSATIVIIMLETISCCCSCWSNRFQKVKKEGEQLVYHIIHSICSWCILLYLFGTVLRDSLRCCIVYIVIKLYLKNQILVFVPVPPLDRLAIGPGSEDGMW